MSRLAERVASVMSRLQDALDHGRVLGMAQGAEQEQCMHRDQPGVPSADAVAAVAFRVAEERTDQGRVQIGDLQVGWLFAGVLGGEGEQQLQRVAVGDDGVRAGLAALGQAGGR